MKKFYVMRLPGLLTILAILAATLGQVITTAQAAAAVPTPPFFTPSDCMIALAANGQDVKCGYLTVPELHKKPEGKTIQLAVVIIKSKDPNPAPDPLILAQGGPGGSTIDTYAEALLMPTSRIRTNRDIILFDQRGTYYSKPSLVCDETYDLGIRTLNQDLSAEENLKLYEEALNACHDRLTRSGVNLSAYNSFENAADIEDLRKALGYEKVNLYGVSYGTLLALHTMRQYSAGLRSVIIDSVVPPQTNFILQAARSQDRSFGMLFQSCTESSDCNTSYPDLENVFFAQVDRLNETPVHFTLTDPESSETHEALLNGDGFQSLMFQMLYSTEVLPYLPKVIYDARKNDFTLLKRIMEILVFDRTMSYGMYYSVICAEDADFTSSDLDLSGIRPRIADGEEEDVQSVLRTCQYWQVDALGEQADEPVKSDVPTLVLNGNFDPITPPAFGEAAAATLTRSYLVTFPFGGHGAMMSGECQDKIILNFLDNPDTAPDTSCLADNQPKYVTPKSFVRTPVIYKLLTLDGLSAAEFIVYLLALLFLLVGPAVWFLAWLIRLILKRKKVSQPFLVRLGPWVMTLNSLVLLGFLTGFIIAVVQVVSDNNMVFFFGLPEAWRPLFVLPVVGLILSMAMLTYSLFSWVYKFWPIWQRIFYNLLTGAALLCMLVLSLWQTLLVWF